MVCLDGVFGGGLWQVGNWVVVSVDGVFRGVCGKGVGPIRRWFIGRCVIGRWFVGMSY